MNLANKLILGASRDAVLGPGRSRRLIQVLFLILVPLIVWWSLRDISLSEIYDNLRQIGFQAIFLLLTINGLIFILISLRWWLILRAQGLHISLRSMVGFRLAGFGITYFTPGPQFGGEPLQVYLLKDKEEIPLSTGATSVAVDKLLELLANFGFLAFGVFILLTSGSFETKDSFLIMLVPILLLLMPAVYLLMLWAGRCPLSSIIGEIGAHFPESKKFQSTVTVFKETETMLAGFCQHNVKALLLGMILSVVIWGLMVFEFGLMLGFLGVSLSLVKVLIALTAARIAFLLPFPAGLGTLEAGQVMAMGLIGVNPAVGISLSLMIRARDILFGGMGLLLGSYYNR